MIRFLRNNSNKYMSKLVNGKVILYTVTPFITDGLIQDVIIKSVGESLVKYDKVSGKEISSFNTADMKTYIMIYPSVFELTRSRMDFGYAPFGLTSSIDSYFEFQGLKTDRCGFDRRYPYRNSFTVNTILTKLLDSQQIYYNDLLCSSYNSVNSAVAPDNFLKEGMRFLVYNRELTEDEIGQNYRYFNGHVPYYGVNEFDNVKGITNVINGNKYNVVNSLASIVDDPESNAEGVYEDTTNNTTSITYDKILIGGNCDTLYVDYPYPLSVYPKDYRLGDTLHFTYESSNPSVCTVYGGVLFPKTEGIFTLTVRYNGTDLVATKEIKVEKHPIEKEITATYEFAPSDNFVKSVNSFLEDLTITDEDYFLINVVKGNYNVMIPDSGDVMVIPSNCIIDFGGSKLTIIPSNRSYVDTDPYSLFKFTGNCSVVRNFNIIGDKESAENTEKNHYNGVVSFDDSARFCGATNFTVNHMTGMGLTVGSIVYNWWIGENNSSRGRTMYQMYEHGDLDTNGNIVESDTNYVTKNVYTTSANNYTDDTEGLVGIGYSDEYIENYNRLFTLGRMGYGGYPSMARTYRICFYDSDKNFISYEDSILYEAITIPKNTAYFRIALYMESDPTSNTGEDSSFLRLYPYSGGLYCFCSNFNYYDASYSVCSASSNNFYLKKGIGGPAGLWGWSVDFEDGFYNMCHNVILDCVFPNYTAFIGGRSNAFINHRGMIHLANDVENSYIIGGNVSTRYISAKEKITATDYEGTVTVNENTYLNTVLNYPRS